LLLWHSLLSDLRRNGRSTEIAAKPFAINARGKQHAYRSCSNGKYAHGCLLSVYGRVWLVTLPGLPIGFGGVARVATITTMATAKQRGIKMIRMPKNLALLCGMRAAAR
jgi:hypothetical protein